jgi:glucose-1-phosphatase
VPAANIEAIIFDLGNVLIDFDHTIAAKRISKFTNKTHQEIFTLFFNSNITQLFEAGRVSPLDFYLKVKEMLDLKLDYEGFLPIWNEIFFLNQDNQSVYELVKVLKKDYKLALLSNIKVLHYEYLKKNFDIFGAFHKVITSFESKVIKPDHLIYKKALDLLAVFPENVFYTDDREELVNSAKELGIKAFLFKDYPKLRQDLLTQGVRLNKSKMDFKEPL